jgi:hypothetical protein
MHRLVYERARRLSREIWCAIQWGKTSPNWEHSAQYPEPPYAVLLLEQGNIAVGTVAFQHGKFLQQCSAWLAYAIRVGCS